MGEEHIGIATSALSRGVNFPDVKYVVHIGPVRSVMRHIKESGRAGWDGKNAHNVVLYHDNQLATVKIPLWNLRVRGVASEKRFSRNSMMYPAQLPHTTAAVTVTRNVHVLVWNVIGNNFPLTSQEVNHWSAPRQINDRCLNKTNRHCTRPFMKSKMDRLTADHSCLTLQVPLASQKNL